MADISLVSQHTVDSFGTRYLGVGDGGMGRQLVSTDRRDMRLLLTRNATSDKSRIVLITLCLLSWLSNVSHCKATFRSYLDGRLDF